MITDKIFQKALLDFYERCSINASYEGRINEIDFIQKHESYKEELAVESRTILGSKFWKEADVGTGSIGTKVKEATHAKVRDGERRVEHNLLDWRKKSALSEKWSDPRFERLMYQFFKNKFENNETSYQALQEFGLPYQTIAFLFFIKQPEAFLPISQKKFDEIFVELGIEFSTRGKSSWENYSGFLSIMKEVRDLLKPHFTNVSLLDAHSFVYILHPNYSADEDSDKTGIVSGNEEELDDKPDKRSYASEERMIETDFMLDSLDESALSEPQLNEVVIQVKRRNRAVVDKLKKLYAGKCQITGKTGFSKKGDGVPYCEVHHLIPLGEGGSDLPHNLIVVGPEVHRMLHYADVQGLDLERIDDNKLDFQINGEDYTITWNPQHSRLFV